MRRCIEAIPLFVVRTGCSGFCFSTHFIARAKLPNPWFGEPSV
jgi:hypothetical protein